jgi:Cytochrome P450
MQGLLISPRVLVNLLNNIYRGMALDKNIYAEPFTFDPTRFLPQPHGRGEPYPLSNFGFGRRYICFFHYTLHHDMVSTLKTEFVQVVILQKKAFG